MKQEPLFYIPVEHNDNEVLGPYDLVQMARMLRTKIITAETLTFREGEQEWKPFGERPHFVLALEIPADAVSVRSELIKEKEEAAKPPIPMPSTATMVKIGVMAVLLLIGGVISYFISMADTTTGFLITMGGGGVALVGQALILVKVLDEAWIVRLMVIFIPLFDIYYFLTNLDKYLPYFCAKYIGGVLAVTAFAGVASADPAMAEQMKEIFHMAGIPL